MLDGFTDAEREAIAISLVDRAFVLETLDQRGLEHAPFAVAPDRLREMASMVRAFTSAAASPELVAS